MRLIAGFTALAFMVAGLFLAASYRPPCSASAPCARRADQVEWRPSAGSYIGDLTYNIAWQPELADGSPAFATLRKTTDFMTCQRDDRLIDCEALLDGHKGLDVHGAIQDGKAAQ